MKKLVHSKPKIQPTTKVIEIAKEIDGSTTPNARSRCNCPGLRSVKTIMAAKMTKTTIAIAIFFITRPPALPCSGFCAIRTVYGFR